MAVAASRSLAGRWAEGRRGLRAELCPIPFQVQGVGSRGWRDVTTFFSGRAEDPSDRYARPPVLVWPLPGAFPQGLGGSHTLMGLGR